MSPDEDHRARPGRPRNPPNVAGSVYGLILASAVIAASRIEEGRAAPLAATVALTLLVFYLAHVYAVLMGRWAEQQVVPGWPEWKAELYRQWPMVSVAILPVFVLLLGAFDLITDKTAIDVAFFLCIGALSATSWLAARDAGATRPQAAYAVSVAVAFGLVIVALKVFLLH